MVGFWRKGVSGLLEGRRGDPFVAGLTDTGFVVDDRCSC